MNIKRERAARLWLAKRNSTVQWMARRDQSTGRAGTILITAINIIAGFLIGVFQLDIPLAEAAKTYTVLTVAMDS